ncbi:MAG: YvcK family protein [Sheuella sp.]|nr:YvcK family protein [Sheuella sp.]
MGLLKWLYPGMRVKRWIFLCVVGLLLVASGSVMAGLGLTKTPVHRGWLLSGACILALGIGFMISGMRRMVRSLIGVFLPTQREDQLVDLLYRQRQLEKGPKVVVIGGGTGLSTLLTGLKQYTSNLTAIVTVADDGGSSGRLRTAFDMPPPGDIRNCLVALADAEPLMRELFQYRFDEGSELHGHNFGNLFIAAMMRVTGDFETAIRESSRVLAIRGRVTPSTVQPVQLHARLADGRQVVGETNISKAGARIAQLWLEPAGCMPSGDALTALAEADAIVLGPGSLYTSILPNLLVDGIREGVQASRGIKIYICNVMTQHSETDGYTAADHLQALISHTAERLVDYCIVNTAPVPQALLARYREEQAVPVVVDTDALERLGCRVIGQSVISTQNYVRHDSNRLAKLIAELASSAKNRSGRPQPAVVAGA